MTRGRPIPLWAGAVAALAVGAAAEPLESGWHTGQAFSEYPKLAGNSELARRSLSPLNHERLERSIARTGQGYGETAVELQKERFDIYVPRHRPPEGYGLLVFIPPWRGARLPTGWPQVLDREGVMLVSAEGSGNDESVMGRRQPLAVIAALDAMIHYPIDRAHVYVGGFSGGSRVSMRVALAYPDVFRGALLNAGSDPIGNDQAILPPRDLFEQFQQSRIAFLTGEEDQINVGKDSDSMASMRRYCVQGLGWRRISGKDHDVADAAGLEWALRFLRDDKAPAASAACRANLDAKIATDLAAAAKALEADPRNPAARTLLDRIDSRYGGLAAPAILDLYKKETP